MAVRRALGGVFLGSQVPCGSFGVSVQLYNVLICACVLGGETLFSWTSGEQNGLN